MTLAQSLDYYGKLKKAFFFTISYDKTSWEVIALEHLPKSICYSIDTPIVKEQEINLDFTPLRYVKYKEKFDYIIDNIKAGNTYLLNLTSKSKINNQISFQDIYDNSNAKYKLLFKDDFLSFSPETFIKIADNKISTFPMKGTINANIANAKELIMSSKKELAEHTMVVDLLRNDLNIVSTNVRVEKFRYIDKIAAGKNKLYQVSSHISGNLEENWNENISNIILPLLPAGSITGAPKRSTVAIIEDIEDYERNYFTGIWGIFDGKTLDSAVLIRYLEKNKDGIFYKSGGGITLDSICQDEYQEMIDKIYIP